MKKLMIMRHAKSDWSDSSLRDFDRPLNPRGRKAAPAMGKEIKKLGLTPDLIISSPAKRAKMTALAVAENSGYQNEIVWNDDFYFGYNSEILNAIKKVDDSVGSIMIFGHNPTWTSIAEYLSGEFVTMKTADLVVLEFEGNWQSLSESSCRQVMHLSPKELT
jgi:phosphohistidine phosphatase